ncbi:MAG: class I SAM-dependent methyltransferase [Armatimonadota bacterium]|jgi:SAM-dependent methyltransferase
MKEANVDLASEPFERVPCPLCGEDGASALFTAPAPDDPADVFTVEACNACGMAYVNPRPTPEALARRYADDYYAYEFYGARRLRHRIKARILRALKLLPPPGPDEPVPATARLTGAAVRALRGARAVSSLPAPRAGARYLDVGCGAGNGMAHAREAGWETFGVDFSERAIAVAHEHDFPGMVADALQLPVAGESFDFVEMTHMLEHTTDPVGVLREAARVLRPGGTVHLVVPSLSAWSAGRFGPDWMALDLPRHLLHFTPGTMRIAAERAGLRVAAIRALPNRWVFEASMERLELSAAAERLTRLQWRLHCALGRGEDLNVWLTT